MLDLVSGPKCDSCPERSSKSYKYIKIKQMFRLGVSQYNTNNDNHDI